MGKYVWVCLALLVGGCAPFPGDKFTYEYEILEGIRFDFSKSVGVEVGRIRLTNTEDRPKKFRYVHNSPRGHLFNKKTGKPVRLELVVHNSEPEVVDSIFWALLDSATYFTPIPPGGEIWLRAFLNLNYHPHPREIMEYIIGHHRDLEYHIFGPEKEITASEGISPDAVIRFIDLGL